MDSLTIKSILLKGKHGVGEEERRDGNRFELDVTFRGDFTSAAEADDLSLTVNYERVEQLAEKILHGPSQQLIESLCFQIGENLIQEFPSVQALEVTLRKISPRLRHPTAYTEICMKWPR